MINAVWDWLVSSNWFTVLFLSCMNPRILSLVHCDRSGLTKVAPCPLAVKQFCGYHSPHLRSVATSLGRVYSGRRLLWIFHVLFSADA
jgi:hypothetical protein